MISEERRVFVLGAGFTRAFLPEAPLMVDDYDVADLAEKFRGFLHASRILDWERNRYPDGRINIERLMTRLQGLMPYDFDEGAVEELGVLLTEVKRSFIRRIEAAREGSLHRDELAAFARYCVNNDITCVTFNYDDVLDEKLWNVTKWDASYPPIMHRWHPDDGYGFFCKPSDTTVRDIPREFGGSSMLLLKLHGSVNWRPRRGHTEPYVVDAITHHESWFHDPNLPRPTEQDIALHLEPEPFIVPPVLLKSALVEQPILRLVWHRAYEVLIEARHVTFVGYSFPITDIAVNILFQEAFQLPFGPPYIEVVNFAIDDEARQRVMSTYRTNLGNIPDESFDFRGALEWSRGLVATTPDQ